MGVGKIEVALVAGLAPGIEHVDVDATKGRSRGHVGSIPPPEQVVTAEASRDGFGIAVRRTAAGPGHRLLVAAGKNDQRGDARRLARSDRRRVWRAVRARAVPIGAGSDRAAI